MELNFMDFHVKEIISVIGKDIISEIYSSKKLSKVTLSRAKVIVFKSIKEYASNNDDLSPDLLKNKLILFLNSDYKDFVVDLMIYLTNYDEELTPIFRYLEKNRSFFFRIDSLYSENLEYNEILRMKSSKAKMLNVQYIATPTHGIHIVDKNIVSLDLTKLTNVKILDMNRLIQCPFLQTIIISPYLEEILNSKNLPYNKDDYPVKIDITSANLSLATKIYSQHYICRSGFYKKFYDIECHNDALWNCVEQDFQYDDYEQYDEYLGNL